MNVEAMVRILRKLPARPGEGEVALQGRVARALLLAGVTFRREVFLKSARGRIDFLTTRGCGIEVKVGYQSRDRLVDQSEDYLRSEELLALIVLSERRVSRLIKAQLTGAAVRSRKPVLFVELARGVAI